jgi:hypothetical protein
LSDHANSSNATGAGGSGTGLNTLEWWLFKFLL